MTGTQPDHHDPYAALRIRDYRYLLLSTVLAGIGSQVQSVAIGWELYERTGLASALGLVGLVQFLPVFLLSLPAGHAADRYSRQALLIAARSALAVAAAGLAALSYWNGPIPLIYVCLLLVGIGQAFSNPARWSLLPQVVPEEHLGNAVHWNTSGGQVAFMAGPALGGVIVGLARGQTTGAFLTAVLCFLGGVGLSACMRPRPVARAREEMTLQSLLAGIRFVWRTKLFLAAITLDLFAVLLGGATALLPIFAQDILDVGPTGLGWLGAAPAVGAFVMALVMAHRPPLRRAGRTMLWAVAGFGIATIGFGLSRNFVLSFGMLALTGAMDNISVVVRQTLVQVLTPDAMRGRVSAVSAIFIGSSNQLGAFESGITAQWFGPVISVVGGGVGTVVVVGAVMLLWPQVLSLGPLHMAASPIDPSAESGLALEEPTPPGP